jgi:biotin transport system substrate-specific component
MTIALPPMARVPAGERGLTIADFLVPIGVGERIGSRARHIALIVAGALFISLVAQIAYYPPNSPVPVTGQTFGVLLVGGALGFRRGLLSMLLYVALGFFLPVYALHTSGVDRIVSIKEGGLVLGATGGYLIGFIVAGSLVGRLAELGWDRRLGGALAAMAIGNVVIYVIGLPWLAVALHSSVADTVAKGLTPYVVGDLVKLGLAAGAFPVAWWVVGRRPGER